ncbi:Response regulator, two-component system (fragment) [Candidatus Desulfosporosinus infrequens]|uniref:Response regulator, two-component system n=1 Tax=Candidatus Desulfosporosinus infrequens TaxID=2043169 RepID=A0A2U3KV35_9FIRM
MLTQYARKLQSLTKEYITRQTTNTIVGNPPSLPVPAGAVQLTRREQEVLQLIAKEMTNLEIAQVVGISCQTVKIHASNV